MRSKKILYVPRNWKVSYTDADGVLHDNVTISVNKEYRITKKDGSEVVATVSGIKNDNGNTALHIKVMLNSGRMHTMTNVSHHVINMDDIIDITAVVTEYVKCASANRVANNNTPVFTFAFDTDYPTQYKISVHAGEFIALAVKNPNNPNHGRRSIYGHIMNVDAVNGVIKFARYVSFKGVRDVYEMDIELDRLLGVYRYELKIKDADVATGADATEEVATEEVASTEEE